MPWCPMLKSHKSCILNLGCIRVCLWWLVAGLKVKFAVSKLTTYHVNPHYKLKQAFGLSCSAQLTYAWWFVAQTNRQPIRALTFVSIVCWIWLDQVPDLEGRWRNLLYCSCWKSFFTPHLKYSSCLPDACSVGMCTCVKQVNRVTSALYQLIWISDPTTTDLGPWLEREVTGSCHTVLFDSVGKLIIGQDIHLAPV